MCGISFIEDQNLGKHFDLVCPHNEACNVELQIRLKIQINKTSINPKKVVCGLASIHPT